MKADFKEQLLPVVLFLLLLALPDGYVGWRYVLPSRAFGLGVVWLLPTVATVATLSLIHTWRRRR